MQNVTHFVESGTAASNSQALHHRNQRVEAKNLVLVPLDMLLIMRFFCCSKVGESLKTFLVYAKKSKVVKNFASIKKIL